MGIGGVSNFSPSPVPNHYEHKFDETTSLSKNIALSISQSSQSMFPPSEAKSFI